MRWTAFLLGLGLLAAPAQAAVVEEFKVVDWDGLAFTDDATGDFTHCTVYAAYQNGSTFYLSSETSGAWYLSWSNDAWTLDEGESFAIKFRIDRRAPFDGTATALAGNQIGLPIEAENEFIGQLRRGSQLTVSFRDADYPFELSNSNRAMTAAQDCVRRHVALGTRTPVTAQGVGGEDVQSQQQQSQEASPAEDGEAEAQSGAGAPAEEPDTNQAAGVQQTFGPWVVTATNDAEGKFANCTAYGVHGGDQLILSLFPDGVWTFGLSRNGWQLDANQTYYIWYNVDGPADAPGVARRPIDVPEPTRIFFEVTDLEDIMTRIEAGAVLNLQVRALAGAAESFSYPLDQAPEAFSAVRACVANEGTEQAVDDGGSGAAEPGTDQSASADDGEPADAQASASHRELPALGATILEQFAIPGWKAAALSDGEGGAFTHCGIRAEYENGATLGVARSVGGDYLLALQHGDWSLAVGSWVPVSYDITGVNARSEATEGRVEAANLIVANIGGEDAVALALHDAQQLTVKAEGKTLAFDVSDIAPGIEALDECIARHQVSEEAAPVAKKRSDASAAEEAPAPAGKTGGSATPEEAAPAPSPAPDADDSAAAEGGSALPVATVSAQTTIDATAGFTTALLLRAGYPNHVILAANAEKPEGAPEGIARWELGEVMGATLVSDSADPEAVKTAVGGDRLDGCGGMLTMQMVSSDAAHGHFSLTCGTGPALAIMHHVVVPRAEGGSYVFALAGLGDAEAAGAIAAAMYRTSAGS